MMLLKYCIQYASKFGKLSSGHRNGKVQLSFQSQRKTMSKNIQTTVQLCSFHMLARLYSTAFKLGFSSMRTENLQMYKLGLENAEGQEIKLPTSVRLQRKQGNARKNIYFCFIDYVEAFMWITINCGKFLER